MSQHTPAPFRPLGRGGFGIISCQTCNAAQPWPLMQTSPDTQRRWYIEGHNVGDECIGRAYTPFERDAMRHDGGARLQLDPSPLGTTSVAAVHYVPNGHGTLTVGQQYRVTQSQRCEGTLDSVEIINGVLTGITVGGRHITLNPMDTVEAL